MFSNSIYVYEITTIHKKSRHKAKIAECETALDRDHATLENRTASLVLLLWAVHCWLHLKPSVEENTRRMTEQLEFEIQTCNSSRRKVQTGNKLREEGRKRLRSNRNQLLKCWEHHSSNESIDNSNKCCFQDCVLIPIFNPVYPARENSKRGDWKRKDNLRKSTSNSFVRFASLFLFCIHECKNRYDTSVQLLTSIFWGKLVTSEFSKSNALSMQLRLSLQLPLDQGLLWAYSSRRSNKSPPKLPISCCYWTFLEFRLDSWFWDLSESL